MSVVVDIAENVRSCVTEEGLHSYCMDSIALMSRDEIKLFTRLQEAGRTDGSWRAAERISSVTEGCSG